MARTANSAATEVITDSRESPLLLRGFRTGRIGRPPTRHERSLRKENVHYRLLKWIILSISSVFLVNITVLHSIVINQSKTFSLNM